jgi:hypothetical protein
MGRGITTQSLLQVLHQSLQAEEGLRESDFTVDVGRTGGLVLERGCHVRGTWHRCDDRLIWTDAGHSVPSFITGSVAEAVAHTLKMALH